MAAAPRHACAGPEASSWRAAGEDDDVNEKEDRDQKARNEEPRQRRHRRAVGGPDENLKRTGRRQRPERDSDDEVGDPERVP